MEIRNAGPHPAGFVVLFDSDGAERLCVCLRATWAFEPGGRWLPVAAPDPISPLDTFIGEPFKSSIKHEADLGPPKLATDLALVGRAVAPRGRAIPRMEVSLRVGNLHQRALVTGERRLSRGRPGEPRPFETVPLCWELAAGGTDASPEDPKLHSMDMRNPLGRGFRARKSRLPADGAPAAQIRRIDGNESEPVGFGFIGEHWEPRTQYAGTYDEAWVQNRCPLVPKDFNPRFHNKAAPGLVAKGLLQGGEPVEVRGCTVERPLTFNLPAPSLRIEARIANASEPLPMSLSGVTIDCEAMQLRMVWRGDLLIHKRLPKFRRLDVKLEGGPT
jgi:hypothetical protein